jgi:sugar phosphate isomerase/epimerase
MTHIRAGSSKSEVAPIPLEPPWGSLIPDEQWGVFCLGATALEAAGVPYLLHGALALGLFTGHWRNTKDVDGSRCTIASLQELVAFAQPLGVGIMLENVPGRFNSVAQLAPIFGAVPDAALHLDIGHCNLGVARSTAGESIARFGSRLAHVHLHDNRGGHADLHLALGMGDLDVPAHVRELRGANYDGTIALEVFARDRHFLGYSRDRLRELWELPARLVFGPWAD